MGFSGLFCQIYPFLRIPASSARALLHQPLAAGPCTRFLGSKWGLAEKSPKTPILGDFGQKPGFPGFSGVWDPEGPLVTWPGDRAPARGVDVKPPSAGWSDPGTRAPGALPGLWDPFAGSGGLRSPVPGLPGPWGALPRPAQGLVLHQPLAAGPCPRPGVPLRGTGVPGLPSPDGRLVAPYPRPVQGRRDATACRGRVRPQGCLGMCGECWYRMIHSFS